MPAHSYHSPGIGTQSLATPLTTMSPIADMVCISSYYVALHGHWVSHV
jgi:hypothetical protein